MIILKYNQIQIANPKYNPFKGKLRVCERCYNTFRDEGQPDKKTIDGQIIISEYIPLCPTCFHKALHAEKQRQLILGAIGDSIITQKDYQDFKNKKMCHKDFKEKISKGIRKIKRLEVLSDVLVKCESYIWTKKFVRETEKYGLTQKEVIELANKKIRKIVEDDKEIFLND